MKTHYRQLKNIIQKIWTLNIFFFNSPTLVTQPSGTTENFLEFRPGKTRKKVFLRSYFFTIFYFTFFQELDDLGNGYISTHFSATSSESRLSRYSWYSIAHIIIKPPLSHNTVLPLVGAQGRLKSTRNLGVQLTPLQPGGQIMPTTLLLAHPDLKTQRHLWSFYFGGLKLVRFLAKTEHTPSKLLCFVNIHNAEST